MDKDIKTGNKNEVAKKILSIASMLWIGLIIPFVIHEIEPIRDFVKVNIWWIALGCCVPIMLGLILLIDKKISLKWLSVIKRNAVLKKYIKPILKYIPYVSIGVLFAMLILMSLLNIKATYSFYLIIFCVLIFMNIFCIIISFVKKWELYIKVSSFMFLLPIVFITWSVLGNGSFEKTINVISSSLFTDPVYVVTVFEKPWLKNQQGNGNGTITYKNGDYYIGEIKDLKSDGKGKHTYINGDVYDGDFKEGHPNGNGIKINANGSIYEGEWKAGVLDGKGKHTYLNGDVYEGNWKDGYANGKGKLVFKSGGVYEGNWKNGSYDGEGKMIYANGDIYNGNWNDGSRDGKGKMTFANGSIYNGNWKDDDANGEGKMTYADGNIYNGNWKNGLRNGEGKWIHRNGDIYEGNWKDHLPHGKGKYINPKGKVYNGKWIDGVYDDGITTITFS